MNLLRCHAPQLVVVAEEEPWRSSGEPRIHLAPHPRILPEHLQVRSRVLVEPFCRPRDGCRLVLLSLCLSQHNLYFSLSLCPHFFLKSRRCGGNRDKNFFFFNNNREWKDSKSAFACLGFDFISRKKLRLY